MDLALNKFVNKKGGGQWFTGWWSNELYLNYKQQKIAVWFESKIFVLPEFASAVRRAVGIQVEVICEFKAELLREKALSPKIIYTETPGVPATSLMPVSN